MTIESSRDHDCFSSSRLRRRGMKPSIQMHCLPCGQTQTWKVEMAPRRFTTKCIPWFLVYTVFHQLYVENTNSCPVRGANWTVRLVWVNRNITLLSRRDGCNYYSFRCCFYLHAIHIERRGGSVVQPVAYLHKIMWLRATLPWRFSA